MGRGRRADGCWGPAAACTLVAVADTSPAVAAGDRKAPSTPTDFRVVASTSYSASLAWGASTDNSGSVRYILAASTGESVTLPNGTTGYTWRNGLQAGYSYKFTLRAVDAAGNRSATVSATAMLPADRTPPSTPTNLMTAGMEFPDGETWFFWDDSTDDVTPASRITYRVLINGVLDHVVVGYSGTVQYRPTGRTNTIDIVAVDEAGNASAPASITVTVP